MKWLGIISMLLFETLFTAEKYPELDFHDKTIQLEQKEKTVSFTFNQLEDKTLVKNVLIPELLKTIKEGKEEWPLIVRQLFVVVTALTEAD